ncbi:MAG TPA: NUDIX hydrolase [Candidatus Eremiobacteraceae bacterium]|nr:NUDIX hydrolase [Candidatus Eremiobacteraceae bacterium]
MTDRKWEILSSEYVVQSPWYRLRRDACRLPDGTVIDPYYVREHDGFAVVFAVTPDGDVVFAKQYKHGFGGFVLELPAGMLEQGEGPLECARRELEEETGYTSLRFEKIAEFIADPTSSTGLSHVFVALDARPDGVLSPDPGEDIETVLVPVDRVLDEVRSGHIRAQGQVAAVYAALDRLGKLRAV